MQNRSGKGCCPGVENPTSLKSDQASAHVRDEAGFMMQAYADENSLFFWETSAKTNVNVAEVFHDIAERLPRASAAPQPPVGGITLTETVPERTKKSACCS